MSSLFDDGDCGCGGKTSPARHTKCKGCICELLNQLANQSAANFCELGQKQRLLIKNKGAAQPVSLDGTGAPTEFTLEKFDPESCCAIFTYQAMVGTTPTTMVTRTFIEDCRSIAGIACIGTTGTTTPTF